MIYDSRPVVGMDFKTLHCQRHLNVQNFDL